MAGSEAVLAESNKGYTPEEIDERLGLRRGEARRTMIGIWRADNEMAALARESRRRETRANMTA
ncbi:MAG TPA: hypothetical protein DCP91_01370 [Eggerthellaceae bacterium]|nr:hypothetical protein [Eggerthellaceae bacterium]